MLNVNPHVNYPMQNYFEQPMITLNDFHTYRYLIKVRNSYYMEALLAWALMRLRDLSAELFCELFQKIHRER